MNVHNLTMIGRILMAVLFLVAAYRKITAYAGTAAYFTKLGFPAPEAMVAVAIVIELIGGIALLTGYRLRQVVWLLILFIVIGTFMAHRFWEFDAAQLGNQLNHFIKNLAIIGGLLWIRIDPEKGLAQEKC